MVSQSPSNPIDYNQPLPLVLANVANVLVIASATAAHSSANVYRCVAGVVCGRRSPLPVSTQRAAVKGGVLGNMVD